MSGACIFHSDSASIASCRKESLKNNNAEKERERAIACDGRLKWAPCVNCVLHRGGEGGEMRPKLRASLPPSPLKWYEHSVPAIGSDPQFSLAHWIWLPLLLPRARSLKFCNFRLTSEALGSENPFAVFHCCIGRIETDAWMKWDYALGAMYK